MVENQKCHNYRTDPFVKGWREAGAIIATNRDAHPEPPLYPNP